VTLSHARDTKNKTLTQTKLFPVSGKCAGKHTFYGRFSEGDAGASTFAETSAFFCVQPEPFASGRAQLNFVTSGAIFQYFNSSNNLNLSKYGNQV
jgi:hypothetical protein